MAFPNFFIIGAQKAGTTSLYYYLGQHPDVYMSPVKEPDFFAVNDVDEGDEVLECPGAGEVANLEDYKALFKDVDGQKAIGEASTRYLRSLQAAERIKQRVPNAKLVALLRHPAERAYSHYRHLVRDNRESESFERAIELERAGQRGLQRGGNYLANGFYYEQLTRYYERFDPRQIKIYRYDHFKKDSLSIVKDIFRFLGVDECFEPNISTQHNKSGTPRLKLLHNLLVNSNPVKDVIEPHVPYGLRRLTIKVRDWNLAQKKDKMDSATRRVLIDIYRSDVSKLPDLTGQDFSDWIE